MDLTFDIRIPKKSRFATTMPNLTPKGFLDSKVDILWSTNTNLNLTIFFFFLILTNKMKLVNFTFQCIL